MSTLRPANLTPRELLRYALLERDANGALPAAWSDALMTALARALERDMQDAPIVRQ